MMRQEDPPEDGITHAGNPHILFDFDKADDLLRVLFEESLDAIFITDRRGRYTAVNDQASRLTGYTREKLLSMTLADLLPPEDIDLPPNIREKLRQGDHVMIERRIRRREEELLPVQVLVRMLSDGQTIGIVRDISERKQTEQVLQEGEEKFQAIFDSINDAIFIQDLESGAVIDVNQRMCEMYGYTRGEACAMTIGDFSENVPPYDQEHAMEWLQKTAEGPQTFDWRARTRDGRLFWVEVNMRRAKKIGLQDLLLVVVRDITVRKQELEALRFLQFSINRASDNLLGLDEEANLIYANDAACASLGYTREELLMMKIHDLDPDFPPEAWLPHIEKLRPQGSITFESRHRTKDGRIFPVEVTGNYLEYEGHFYSFAFDRDITERKQAEEALRLTQFSVDRASDSILWLDEEANLIYANDAACTSLGYTREELMQMSIHDLDPDFPPEAWPPHVEELRRRKAITFESCHRTKSGRTFPVEVTCNYFEYNGRFYSFSFDRDITERKKNEEVLRQSEVRFRTLLQNVPAIAIQGYRLDGTTTYWNQASEELYGYTSEEAIGRSLLELIIPPDMRREVEDSMQHMNETRQPIPSDELTLMRRDGTPVHVFSNHAIVQLPDSPPELFCLDIDLTDRKVAEEEKEKLQDQLLQAQKMESVGRLAGGVAHDFNNMLTAILGHAQLAMMTIPSSHPIYTNLKIVQDSALRSADLVRQLLAFARKQTIAPKILDLNDTAAGMLKILSRIIGENIDLVWRPGENLWPVRIDPSQIDQLLANLCVNARDAITGGGQVTIETRNTVFDEAYCDYHPDVIPGDYVMLAVSDNGSGMTRDILDHLFEPFFTTKALGKGTGLGMATVYGIVKQNEGIIHVYSEQGLGTTFKIYLPRHRGELVETPIETISSVTEGQGELILLVEDEEVILNLGRTILEKLGYRVLAAITPGEAVCHAEKHINEIALLITDVVMPEMNGRDLAKKLTDMRPGLKCLFASGYTTNVIAHSGVLDEGVHFIQKPFSLESMAIKVREVLDRE